jgi:hypothetical protein
MIGEWIVIQPQRLFICILLVLYFPESYYSSFFAYFSAPLRLCERFFLVSNRRGFMAQKAFNLLHQLADAERFALDFVVPDAVDEVGRA